MKFTLTHNDRLLTLTEATEIEISQLDLTLKKRIDSWKWDPRVKKGWWDGYISYFLKQRYVPSGLWKEVLDMCKEYNFPLIIEGIERLFDKELTREQFDEWVQTKWENSKKYPRPYQIETAYQIIRNKSCLAELATSAGKSLIVYMVIQFLLETDEDVNNVLMIVPKVDLVGQAHDDFHEYNEDSTQIDLNIQQIHGGSKLKEGCNITIGTYQSLVKKGKEYFDKFDVVIVDECLHPDTLISMSDGTFKKIKDIQIGDLVKTTNDKTLEIEDREVDFVYKNLSNEQMFEIEMEDGSIIKLTGNHKVKLTSGKYKRTDELTLDDEILSID